MTLLMCIWWLIAVIIWLDARSRNTKNAFLWALGSYFLHIVVIPLYLATRPLKAGEIREGGLVWNTCRSFVLVWTVSLATLLLPGGLDYEKLGAGEYGGIAKGGVFLIAGSVWFGVMVVALVVGMVGKNSAIVEHGTGTIVRQGSTSSDLRIVFKVSATIIFVYALIQGSSWLIERVSTGVEYMKQAWINREPVYLYPASGEYETVLTVAAGAQDPPGATVGIRHVLPGTKVQVIGEGPIVKTKQIRVLEGEFTGVEGWVDSNCLVANRVAFNATSQLPDSGSIGGWTFQTDAEIECSPLIHSGAVYVGSGDRNLYAIDTRTGAERWHFQANAGIDGGITASDGKIFCGSKNGILYAIQESNGHLVWKYEPTQVNDTSAIFTTPLVRGGKVYFGSLSGYVRALDINTGSQVWEYKTQAEANSSPVIQNQTVFFGSRDGNIYAVDAATGEQRWKFNANGTINDAPLLDRGSVIFSATEYDPSASSIYAVDAQTGSQQWRSKMPSESAGDFTPVVFGNRVFCTASGQAGKRNEHYLYALNRTKGEVIWKRRIPKAMTCLSHYKNSLVFGSTDGLYIASTLDGSLQFSQRCGEIKLSKPAVLGLTAYVGSTDHSLYAIALPNVPAQSTLAALYQMVEIGGGGITGDTGINGDAGITSFSGTSSSAGVIDPALLYLQQENGQLSNQINILQQNNVKAQKELQRLRQKLNETKEMINNREAAIASLQNTLRITEENSQSKDATVEDMRKTLELWKSGYRSECRSQIGCQNPAKSVAELPESASKHWPNVQDFQPAVYKRDVERRLYRIAAERKLAESGTGAYVNVRFTIEKDGRPTNILLMTPIEDEKTKTRCLRYIEAAGPFRPLLSNDLQSLNVEAKLSQTANGQVQISSLEIEALGNKL